MLALAFKINLFKLANRSADVRYKLPEHIQYLSDGELREDGYDYAKDGELLLFMVGEDTFQVEPFLDHLFDEPFEDNDMSRGSRPRRRLLRGLPSGIRRQIRHGLTAPAAKLL